MHGDTPSFTLQQMVQTALGGSHALGMDKLAQEAGETVDCEECGKSAPPGSKLCRECAAKENRSEMAQQNGGSSEEGETEKTSSAYLQKMAGAVTQIVENFDDLDWSEIKTAFPSPNIVGKQPPGSPQSGPGTGSNAFQTTDKSPPGTGLQSEETGEAKTGKPPINPPMDTGANPKSAPNAMDDNMDVTQTPYPEEGVMKQGSGIEQLYQRVMMRKAAADAEAPASISAPKNQTLTLPEDQPSQMKRPPEVTSQESLIASNQAVIDATRREAKDVPKKRMGEVLSEPAQSRSTDKVLDANLGRDIVDKGGAKVAAAKVLLQKIASQGCRCTQSSLEKGSCDFCKLASRMEQRKDQMRKGGQVPSAMPMMPPPQAGGSDSAPQPQPVTGGATPMPGAGM